MVYHALDKSGEPNVTSQEVFQPVADAAYAKLDAVRNAETKLQEARFDFDYDYLNMGLFFQV